MLPIRFSALLSTGCGPRVGDSFTQNSGYRSNVLLFHPNRLSETHAAVVNTYCVDARLEACRKVLSLPLSADGSRAYGRIRGAVTENLPRPVSKSTLPRNVLSRRIKRFASTYCPVTALIGTFGSGRRSRTILVSGNGSAARMRSRVACVGVFACRVTPEFSR